MGIFGTIYRILPVYSNNENKKCGYLVQNGTKLFGGWWNETMECMNEDGHLVQKDAIFSTEEEAREFIKSLTTIICDSTNTTPQ